MFTEVRVVVLIYKLGEKPLRCRIMCPPFWLRIRFSNLRCSPDNNRDVFRNVIRRRAGGGGVDGFTEVSSATQASSITHLQATTAKKTHTHTHTHTFDPIIEPATDFMRSKKRGKTGESRLKA